MQLEGFGRCRCKSLTLRQQPATPRSMLRVLPRHAAASKADMTGTEGMQDSCYSHPGLPVLQGLLLQLLRDLRHVAGDDAPVPLRRGEGANTEYTAIAATMASQQQPARQWLRNDWLLLVSKCTW